jgi:hypothetical protein
MQASGYKGFTLTKFGELTEYLSTYSASLWPARFTELPAGYGAMLQMSGGPKLGPRAGEPIVASHFAVEIQLDTVSQVFHPTWRTTGPCGVGEFKRFVLRSISFGGPFYPRPDSLRRLFISNKLNQD